MTGTALRNSKSWNDRMEYWAEQSAGGASSAALVALMTEVRDLLSQVQSQTDGLELTSDNINLNAEQINLNTDGVETLLTAVDAKLAELLIQPEVVLTESHLTLDGTEQALAPANTQSQGLLLLGVKANGDPNGAIVRIGTTSGALRFRLYPEAERAIDPPTDGYVDLSQILVQGVIGDGIAIWTMNYGTPNA
jgi:hypothetical protein